MPDFLFLAALLLSKLFVPLPINNDSFLFMNGSTWAQLWSGIIGAVIGSIAAALVASYVLRKTLAAQQLLAADALALQRRLGAEAMQKQADLADAQIREQRTALGMQLAEQRAGLEKQLAEQGRIASEAAALQREQAQINTLEQQRALSLQLSEQRAEASKARMFEAIADLLTACQRLLNNFTKGQEVIEEVHMSAESAVARWGLDLTEENEFKEELREWPFLLWRLGNAAYSEHKRGTKGIPVADRAGWQGLASGTSSLQVAAFNGAHADKEGYAAITEMLVRERRKLEAGYHKYVNSLPNPSGENNLSTEAPT